MNGRLAHTLVALLCLPASASAAVYTLDFGKNLNVWSWDQTIGWSRSVGGRFTASANAVHSRRVSEISDGAHRSGSVKADALFTYALTSKLSMGAGITVDQSNLTTGAYTSEVISRKADLRLRYAPTSGIVLRQSLGRAFDRRRGVGNAGVAYGTEVVISPFRERLRRKGLSLSVNYTHDGVRSPQGDLEREFAISGAYVRGERFAQRFQYRERENVQRYVSASPGNPILQRLTRSRSISAQMEGTHALIGAVALSGEYTSGAVDDDASDDPNNLKYRTDNRTDGIAGALRWRLPLSRPMLVYRVAIGRNLREADPIVHALPGTADSVTLPNELDRRQFSLNMALSSALAIGARDSFIVSGMLALMRDHTPSNAEVNDRDDYRRSLVATYRHTFSHGTSVELRMERTEIHQVWLKRERSANTKWDRALNLWATAQAKMGPVTLTQRSFFKAALEEFDFDYLTPDRPRSRNVRIGRVEFGGDVPCPGDGTFSAVYSLEARTRGILLPPDRPGQRPTLWQLTRNELAEILRFVLSGPIADRWRLSSTLSLSRERGYRPTRAQWHPLHLGVEQDRQEALHAELRGSYSPRGSIFSGDVLMFSAARTYWRRGDFHERRSYLSFSYQHTF